jgi:hypothetical protein
MTHDLIGDIHGHADELKALQGNGGLEGFKVR